MPRYAHIGARGMGFRGLGQHRIATFSTMPKVTIGRRYGRVHVHGIDTDAKAFIEALYGAQIGLSTQSGTCVAKRLATNAIDHLVKQLKNYGIWTLCDCIFPMLGSNFQQGSSEFGHSLNLKSPVFVSTSPSFALEWTGSVPPKCSDLGFIGSTNCFGKTVYQIKAHGNFNWHCAAYIACQGANSYCPVSFTNFRFVFPNATDSIRLVANGLTTDATSCDPFGFGIASRTSSTSVSLYSRGKLLINDTTSVASSLSNAATDIGLINSGGAGSFPVLSPMSFLSLGAGLTDDQAFNYWQAVQEFQTRLGRGI